MEWGVPLIVVTEMTGSPALCCVTFGKLLNLSVHLFLLLSGDDESTLPYGVNSQGCLKIK